MYNMITCMYSEILQKRIKLDDEAGTVTVDEMKLFGRRGRVQYSAEEVQIIKETAGEIDPQLHMIKNVFDGEIVREER